MNDVKHTILVLHKQFISTKIAFVADVKREGGRDGGKKEKKERGKKGDGIGETRKGTPAIITPFCSLLQTLAIANSDWLIKQ